MSSSHGDRAESSALGCVQEVLECTRAPRVSISLGFCCLFMHELRCGMKSIKQKSTISISKEHTHPHTLLVWTYWFFFISVHYETLSSLTILRKWKWCEIETFSKIIDWRLLSHQYLVFAVWIQAYKTRYDQGVEVKCNANLLLCL